MDWAIIHATAERQLGLLTLPQLQAAGTSHGEIRRCLASGRLWKIRRGLYATREPTGSFGERVMSACLHPSIRRIAASGLTAAHLWGMWEEPERLEVSVRYPAQVRLGEHIRVHRSRDLIANDITRLDAIPTTTPERTLLDMARDLPEREVLRVLEHGVVSAQIDLGRLWQLRRRVGRQGRVGAGVVDRAIMAMHPDITRTESGPEAGLLRHLASFTLPQPESQWPVRVAGRRFRIDFAYPQALVGIEYDGAAWHTAPHRRQADIARDELLATAGWTIVRIVAADLRPPVNPEPFEMIRRHLVERSPVL